MNYIEYIEEEVKEEIFEGTYILDGLRLTEEQQREKIFNLMRTAGVEVGDESLLEIGYEGADDDYGISETQSTKFIVTRRTTKKVPYKVTKEEVFEGTFILDGLRLTEEQQREKIFNLMVQAGVEISKEEFDTFEIGYEGADDDYGISETQSTRFVVYKVTKERLAENEVVESNDLEQVLNEIKTLRDKLNSIVYDVSKTDIIQELMDKTEGLERMISNNEKANSNVYTEAIKEIDVQLLLIEKELKEAIKLYEESYEKMRKILEEENERLNSAGLLTDEEYNQIIMEFLGKRMEENERTIKIKKEIEARKKQIASLKRRKNKIKKDLMNSEALGIPASQYQSITNTLKKRKLVNAIFEAKGLEEILAVPSKERTKEQQKKLKEAKEEIIEEIAKLQKSQDNGMSVLDAIEALYGIDTEMVMKGKAKEYKLTKQEFDNLKNNVALLPEKIVVRDKSLINNHVLNSINPTAAPEDMVEVIDKKVQEEVNNEVKEEVVEEKEEEKVTEEVAEDAKPVEMITLFIDDENLDVYARKYVFDRFHLERHSDEVIIDESVCFKMDEEDADWIIENKDNNYSPYIIDTRQVKIEKEKEERKEEVNKPIEKITVYIDVDNNNEVYGSRYLFGRFNMDMLSDEVRIDGKACFRMSEEDATFILGNQDNNYSPYVVETRKIQLGKKEDKVVEKPVEKMTLYIDTDNNNEVYGNRYLFNRFNLKTLGSEIRIDGKVCFRMDENDADYILGNQNNNYSPYVVETREVRMGKKEKTEEADEKTHELANEMSIAEFYMLILHPEYKDINKLDKDTQRSLFIDYWYIRDNYKDIHEVFQKMKNYYSGADIDDKSLLISILPKYVVEQEMSRRAERGEDFISEKEYKDAIYKALANKERYMPEWSYTETMLSEITSVNTKDVILKQNNLPIDKEFKVEKPEIHKPRDVRPDYRHNGIAPLNKLRNIINNILVNYVRNIYSVDEAISELAKVFQENTNAINKALEGVENKNKVRKALMNIINNRNALYEMCGIIVGELTDNEQIQYVNLEDAFKITDLEGDVYNQVVTYLMSTLLIQQTESQIIVDNKVVEHIDTKNKRR